MIEAIILDWGGVLMRTVDPGPRLAWDKRLGLAPGGVNALVFESADWLATLDGRLDYDEFWAQLGARMGWSGQTLAEFRTDFFAGDQLDQELAAWVRSLRPRFKTALLSNFSRSLRVLLAECQVEDAFDAIVISGEAGLVKPDARIYHLAAERLGVAPAECLFVDDAAENIAGALAAGMQAVRFAPVENAKRELWRRLAVEAVG